MSSTSNHVLPDPATRRSVLRHTLPVPLVLLLAACGGRYELGEVMQELEVENPVDVKAVGSVIIDEMADGDVEISSARADAVGDVNGDGHDDWITSVVDRDPDDGKYDYHLLYGGPRPADGVLTPAGPIVSMPEYWSIMQPTSAGDVDGDGYGDVIWRAANNYITFDDDDPPAPFHWSRGSTQRSYLMYGGANAGAGELYVPDVGGTFYVVEDVRARAMARWRAEGGTEREVVSANQETTLVGVGDIDADGFDDLAYTFSVEPYDMKTEAVTYIFYGAAQRLSGDALPARSAELPDVARVNRIGDVDGDGFADFVAQRNDGRVAVMPGGAARLAGTVDVLDAGIQFNPLGGPALVQRYGAPALGIDGVGDLDRDGYADIIVYQTLTSDTSRAYLFYGGPSRWNEPFFVDYADAAFDLFGRQYIRSIGDWNGDGHADLLFAQEEYKSLSDVSEANQRQSALIIPGGGDRYSGLYVTPGVAPDLDLDNPQLLQRLSITPMGDIDGDGRSDVMFSSYAGDRIKYGGPLSPTIY